MKKLIKIFSCAIMVCLTLSLLTACSELPREHDHILEKHEAIGSTCIQNGAIEYYTCECGKIFADAEGEMEITEADLVTDKAAHTWGEYLSDGNATCMADGTKTATCQVEGCGATDTVTDEGTKLDHSFTTYTSNGDATCLADGTKTAICDTDGCNEKDTVTDEGSKLDHSFTTYVYNNDATCTENGTETATCDTDGCSETSTRVVENSALGHSYSDTAVCGTCEAVATNAEMIALGYVAKANGVYYKALGTAVEAAGAKTVTVIADSAEDVTLGASSILKIASGVNYTGNVSNYTATVSGDAVAYFASSAKALTSYTTCGKEVTIKLYEDITASKQIAFAKGYVVTLDLNGHTVTSTMTNTYSRLFLTRDNFVLTSSVAGSKIELTTAAGLLQTSSDNAAAIVSVSNVEINQAVNADSELVLNYASLNVEDVVINVTGKKSVFSTYGNLTVGVAEINVTGVLGTSLINNNGAVEVLLDGTTMNVAGFRVNGGAFFSKNQATSFVLNNVNLDLVIDETYPSYFFNRTENVQVIGGNFNVRGAKPYEISANGVWSIAPTDVSDATELSDAISSGSDFIRLGTGSYNMPSSSTTGEIKIVGTEDSVIDVTKGAYMDSATLTIEGVTIKTSTGYVTDAYGNKGSDYAALYSENVTYVNCTFVGPMRIGRDGAKFVNCTFTELGNDYIWTYGNDVTFEGCVFNTDGKAILIYSDGGNEVSKVTVTNCTFNSTKGAKAGAIANQNCAAIEIHNYGNGVNLTTSGNTYDANFSGEWRIKTYESGRPGIIVNEIEYTTIAIDGKLMTIDASKNVTIVE